MHQVPVHQQEAAPRWGPGSRPAAPRCGLLHSPAAPPAVHFWPRLPCRLTSCSEVLSCKIPSLEPLPLTWTFQTARRRSARPSRPAHHGSWWRSCRAATGRWRSASPARFASTATSGLVFQCGHGACAPLWRGAQRLPHLPPAHPRSHPDLRSRRAPPPRPFWGHAPAAALASPFSVFYKKIAGLCAWLPVWGRAVQVPQPGTVLTAPSTPLAQRWVLRFGQRPCRASFRSVFWPFFPGLTGPECCPHPGRKERGPGLWCRPGVLSGPKPQQ